MVDIIKQLKIFFCGYPRPGISNSRLEVNVIILHHICGFVDAELQIKWYAINKYKREFHSTVALVKVLSTNHQHWNGFTLKHINLPFPPRSNYFIPLSRRIEFLEIPKIKKMNYAEFEVLLYISTLQKAIYAICFQMPNFHTVFEMWKLSMTTFWSNFVLPSKITFASSIYAFEYLL